MGTRRRARVRGDHPRPADRPRGRRLAAARGASLVLGHRAGRSRSGCCSRRSASRRARRAGPTRTRSPARCSWSAGVVFPLAVAARPRSQVVGLVNPITWWVAGVRLRARARAGPSSIGGEGSVWTAVTGTSAPDGADDRRRLVADRGAGYTRGHRDLPIERTSCQGARAAGSDHRLVAPGVGRVRRRRSEGEPMRIYEGSPRQDFEEVFRSIGAFLDSRGMRDILLVEVPGRVRRPGARRGRRGDGGAWSETIGHGHEGDAELLRRRHREVHGGGGRPPRRPGSRGDRRGRQPRARAARDRPLDGHAEAQGRVPVRAGRARTSSGCSSRARRGSHHTLGEFTREDVEHLVSRRAGARGVPRRSPRPSAGPGGTARRHRPPARPG